MYDSNKFEDPWYRELTPKAKLFWEYLLCQCDCAGIWKPDFALASFCIGFKYDPTIEAEFSGRVVFLANGNWFIPKFLKYQYGPLDNQKSGVVRGVLKSLNNNGLSYPECMTEKPLEKPLPKGNDTLSNTLSVALPKVTGVGIGKGLDNNSLDKLLADTFDSLWEQYPNKAGRKDALSHFKRTVKSQKQVDLINTALKNYLIYTAGKDPQYIKHGSTWFNQWEDWVNNPIVDKEADQVNARNLSAFQRLQKQMEADNEHHKQHTS
jgi:hypothetical protein